MDTEGEILNAKDKLVSESAAESCAKEPGEGFDSGRREGVEEGRCMERSEQAARIENLERKKIEGAAKLSEQFALERINFLHAVEPEIVKLALRVAERILRREVQVDPLMLTGAIRVALSQLADSTTVRIRVPAKDAELWSATIANLPSLRFKPAVIADEELREGDCELETSSGSVDLSIESQLQEVSRSLLVETAIEFNGKT